MMRMVLLGGMLAAAVSTAGATEFPAPPVPFTPGHFLAAPPVPGSGGPFMNLVMLAEQLDLTPEQRKKAGAIVDRVTPQLRELTFRMIDTRKALEDLSKGEADDSELRRLANEQGEIISEMTYLSLKSRADVRALLTAEQREKLDEMRGGRFKVLRRLHGPLGAEPEVLQLL